MRKLLLHELLANVTRLKVCHSEAEMVVKVCVTLQDIINDEIMSDYLRITQTFLYQSL